LEILRFIIYKLLKKLVKFQFLAINKDLKTQSFIIDKILYIKLEVILLLLVYLFSAIIYKVEIYLEKL
jgi:hypothetical protein